MKVRVDYIPITDPRFSPTSQSSSSARTCSSSAEGRRSEGGREHVRANHAPWHAGRSTCLRTSSPWMCPRNAAGDGRQASVYQKTVPLPPGKYRLNVVCKDVMGGNMTNYEMALDVPRLDDEKLAASTVILADCIESVPPRASGPGQFVIGTSKVRPRVDEIFQRDEKLGIYLQLYNFQADEKTHKPAGSVEYEITKNGSNEKVLAYSEEIAQLKGSATQITIEKLLPLKTLEPGQYTLKMKVEDKLRNQSITPTATFTVQ